MVVEYEDLSPLARAYLGVIAMGLVPARLASDESFRIDYLTAICEALLAGRSVDAPPGGDGHEPPAPFRDELRAAIAELDGLGVILAGGDGVTAMLPIIGSPMSKLTPAQIARLDLNQPPRVLDNYLAHKALDAILSHPGVYAFLMGKYAESSEIWQRLVAQGYGR